VRQAAFVERYAPEWDAFEEWLKRRSGLRRGAHTDEPQAALSDAAVPARYRRLCQHLALARDRQYSPDLVDRLNALALRGHHLLYGASGGRRQRGMEFVRSGFPRAVRQEGRFVFAAAALFFGPFLAMVAALQYFPDFASFVLAPERIAQFNEMYDPANPRLGTRGSDTDFAMFGYYVWNNVRIGFQTFAGGLLFGIGTVYYLAANGVVIGAVAGYVTQIGFAVPFYSFTVGHSALELTAIVISGAAGLKLGSALCAPGARSRRSALIATAGTAVRLMWGAAGMFLLAAVVEGFWSPVTSVAFAAKMAVALVLWIMVIGYLALGGRGHAD
jgi:uncharacterized membrane protein SpoIIM required for sporulation